MYGENLFGRQFVSSSFLKKRFLLFWICDSVALAQFCKLISFCI